MKVLLIAPFFDKHRPGESWSTYKWIEGISKTHDVTVLTTHRRDWDSKMSPTDAKEIVNWTDPTLPNFLDRLNCELKPTYLLFYFRARKWIKSAIKNGVEFDLVHQINPLALRYPCPAQGLGLKYIMGPLAGSINNPKGFQKEASEKQWYRKLRGLDRFRIKNDPWLNRSYTEAEAILGVAPYVKDVLSSIDLKRFEIASETGIESTSTSKQEAPLENGPLKLLFVGRIIRTKGVIDAVRAVAMASKNCKIQFDVVGQGDMLEACKNEAEKLGASDVINFHGNIPRDEVNKWYKKSDVFLFPSFREPSGNVVFEAMSYGLPVISSNLGGPDYVVDKTCGFNVTASNPIDYPIEISKIIEKLASDKAMVNHLSQNAFTRINELAYWPNKIRDILSLYESLPSQ